MAECPLCGADLDVEEEDLDEGDVLSCDECGATLTVTDLNPLEIEELEEDDYDEEEEDSDDNGDDPWAEL
jgi:alpha-aminoadipate carrier protein LysW